MWPENKIATNLIPLNLLVIQNTLWMVTQAWNPSPIWNRNKKNKNEKTFPQYNILMRPHKTAPIASEL